MCFCPNRFRNIEVLSCPVNYEGVLAAIKERKREVTRSISPSLEMAPVAVLACCASCAALTRRSRRLRLWNPPSGRRWWKLSGAEPRGFSRRPVRSRHWKCITSVQSGQVWANSQQLRQVLEALARAVPPRLIDAKGADILTQREQDVVACLAEGLTNREVARRLKLSEHTVKNYLLHIFDKLGVSSRVEVVLYASGQRILTKNPDPNPELEEDLPTDDEALLTSYRQAARQGYPVSQFRLGSIYREGRGRAADPISAYVWFELARVTSEKLNQKSKDARDQVAGGLSQEQLAEAHRRISGWLRLFD